ncbi:MAG: hypothetical protein Q7T70_03085 [Polaromonas sp.]|nr:hypothetical protein [Polaromonas sp.]
MKSLLSALPAVLALAFLTGCPQSKVPDKPPMVPQPKALTLTGNLL